MSTSELPYGAIKIFLALVGVAGAGSLMMWLAKGDDSTIRSWEIVRANQQDAVAQKRLADAEIFGRQEVRLSERLGSSNYRVAISHDDLGQILIGEKKDDEAKKHFDDAEKILSTNIIRAKDDLTRRMLLADLSSTQSNLGRLELAQGNKDSAIKLLTEAIANLEGCVRDAGTGRLDLFIAHKQVDLFSSMARLSLKLGQKEEALNFFRKAVSLADQSFYPMFLIKPLKVEFSRLLIQNGNNVEADSLFSFEHWAAFAEAAENSKNEGDFAAYARNLRTAADAAKTSKSTMHLAVISLKKLAKVQIHENNPGAARETCIEALHVWKNLAGGADSEADYVMGLLTRLAQSKDTAIDAQTARLKLRRDLYGKTDFHVAETATDLAALYLEKGDSKTALLYANQAFDIFNQLRIKSRGLGIQELTLGKIFEQTSLLAKAEAMYSRALAEQMRRDKKNAALISEICQHLSTVFQLQGRENESRNAQREAQRWRSYLLH